MNIFESKKVKDVYEDIAEHFDDTRYYVWGPIKEFIDSIPSGSLLMDIGFGNGKHFYRKDLINLGLDCTEKFCELSKERYPKACLIKGAFPVIPYRDGCVDYLVSIAVIHHLNSFERRIKSISEIIRLLRKGGQAVITFWAFDKKDPKRSKPDSMVKWELKSMYQKDKTKPKSTEKSKSIVYYRYYHFTDEKELNDYFNHPEIKDKISFEYFLDFQNWYVKITRA